MQIIREKPIIQLIMKEGREAAPITSESFLGLVSSQLNRELTPKEVRGFKRLFKDYTPADCQGYFLQVMADIEESEISLDGYLREAKRTAYGLIRTLIEDDELDITRADEDARENEIGEEVFRKSPDLFANPDDQG